jgi:malate dehydrogenase
MGVPVVIGAGGVEKSSTIALTADEKAMLDKSAAAVRELIEASKKL